MFGLFKGRENLMALKNAINAKLMFEKCSDEEKEKIKRSAIALYRSGGRSHVFSSINPEHQKYAIEEIDEDEKGDDYRFYSMVSYAFQSLGHQPTLPNEEWQTISNAFTLQIQEKDINAAEDWFRQKHGIATHMKV